jgi:hypothetical protein
VGTLFGETLHGSIDRVGGRATVEIPDFDCSDALKAQTKQPYFRISANLGAVSDLEYQPLQKGYLPVVDRPNTMRSFATTPWYPCLGSVPQQLLMLELKGLANHPLTTDETLVLTIVMEFAGVDAFGAPYCLKGEGAGLIVAVG